MAEGKRQHSDSVEEELAAIEGGNSIETQAKISKYIGFAESSHEGWLGNKFKLKSKYQFYRKA